MRMRPPSRRRSTRGSLITIPLLVAVVLAAWGRVASAQTPFVPYFGKNNIHYDKFEWHIYQTDHFEIYYYPEIEQHLERVASYAESAYQQVSADLKHDLAFKVPLVIFKTHVEFEQQNVIPGAAQEGVAAFAEPTRNRMLLPLDEPPDLLYRTITHELTHIFHLSRAEGLWKLGRYILGRHPILFPNAYMPAWVTEGLAVYYESRLTGTGRLEGSEHYMIARAAAEAGSFPRLNEISLATSRFPGGETVYAYGSFIFDYLSRTKGPESIPRFIDQSSRSIFPLTLGGKSKKAFGISFERAWNQWTDSVTRTTQRNPVPIQGWRQLTSEGWLVSPPRWVGDTTEFTIGSSAKLGSSLSNWGSWGGSLLGDGTKT